MQDLEEINETLGKLDGQAIVDWAVEQARDAIIVSTNFGPQEAVILHMATRALPDIPVLWADSGYNTRATYKFALKLIEDLKLNMKIYVPRTTLGYRDAYYGGIPPIEKEELHNQFTEEVKLEPFKRGLSELNPKVWLTAIRKEQTAFRQSLNVASHGQNGLLKISPVFHWTEKQMDEYLKEYGLPSETNYFDPTKVLDKRECGLHPGV